VIWPKCGRVLSQIHGRIRQPDSVVNGFGWLFRVGDQFIRVLFDTFDTFSPFRDLGRISWQPF
jgi:hypothetical protein